MCRVSIIVLTHNGRPMLERFLPSVLASAGDDTEVIVVDNASTDTTASWLDQHQPGVRYVPLAQNGGYTAGNNRGAEAARGQHLVFINNDVEVEPNWLAPLIDRLEADPALAAVQPKLKWWRHPDRFEYGGAAGGYLDRYGIPFCRGRVGEHVEPDHGQYDQPHDIAWASGVAFAIRRDLFFKAGGFDESFFCHMEEIDLCWRLRRLGYRIGYEPASCAYHYGAATIRMGSPLKVYLNHRNNLLMLAKHWPKGVILRRLPLRVLMDGGAALRLFIKGSPGGALAVGRAYLAAAKRLPIALRRRRRLSGIGSLCRDTARACPTSIAWHYFFRRGRASQALDRSIRPNQANLCG